VVGILPLASVRSEHLGKQLRAIPLTGWPRGSTLGLQKAPSYRLKQPSSTSSYRSFIRSHLND
jgi:hypothetical protein